MKLKLGGKEFELKSMTLNHVAELENKGIDLMTFNKDGGFKMSYMKDIVFGLIKGQDPIVTLEWVGEVIDLQNYAEVSKKITSFLAPKSTPAKATT